MRVLNYRHVGKQERWRGDVKYEKRNKDDGCRWPYLHQPQVDFHCLLTVRGGLLISLRYLWQNMGEGRHIGALAVGCLGKPRNQRSCPTILNATKP